MIRVGTSGYAYDHWRHVFYPKGLPTRRWLEHYARIFSNVELNATFYRLPKASAVVGWREGTPPGFRFAAKGSRYLTHMKRADRPWTGDRPLLRGHPSPGKEAVGGPLAAPAADEPGRPRPAGTLPGTTSQGWLAARSRVPEPELVLGGGLRRARRLGRRVLRARPGPPASAARHRRLPVPALSRGDREVPWAVREEGASPLRAGSDDVVRRLVCLLR